MLAHLAQLFELAAPSGAPAALPLPIGSGPQPPAGPPLSATLLHMALPLVGFLIVIPLVYFFFRRTWRELDVESLEHQRKTLATGEIDRRPLVLFVITAVVLTLQWYYDRDFYTAHVRPFLREVELDPTLLPWGLGERVSLRMYGELYNLTWWTFTRLLGYTVIPFGLWKIFFPKDSLLDMGLRVKGLTRHAWIYLLCLAAVVPAVYAMRFTSRSPRSSRCSSRSDASTLARIASSWPSTSCVVNTVADATFDSGIPSFASACFSSAILSNGARTASRPERIASKAASRTIGPFFAVFIVSARTTKA